MSSSKGCPWTVCPKCQGEGQVKRRLPKRARKEEPGGAMGKPCNSCGGSGLQAVSQEAADSMPKADASDKSLPRVAIIGGGIGGLALGVACWHRNIPFTVYERDTSFLQRKQGYGLTLQQASKALKGFGIQSVAGGITSTRHVVHTQDGQQVAEWGLRKWGRSSPSKPRRQNVHIARQALRYELLQALQEQVQWGFQLKGLKETDNNVELTFAHADGKEIAETADVVVGADGIRSTVRSFLVEETQTPLQYLGCLVILGICPLGALERYQESELFDGHTVFQTADGTTRLYAMPFSKSEYMWQLSFPEEEDKAKMASQTGTLKEAALQKCETWHDPIPQLLRATPADFISGYPVYDRSLLEPRILASKSKRVTLLGDAAHPMSPFKGQGANQALLDALSLARALYREPIDVALSTYANEMLSRSAVKVQASADAAQFLHTDVAIEQGNVTRGAAAVAAKWKEDANS